MSARYASGKKALGICDRCGFTYKLDELQYEVEDQHLNGLRVCPPCYDMDHPQLQLGEIIIDDPQSLYDPRPDNQEVASTSFAGWRPVGSPSTFVEGAIGEVTVVIGD